MPAELTLQTVKEALSDRAAAFRCVTDYQPAGGPGDKVFPPTYAGGKYATEERIDPNTGEIRKCVLLDSVQSQANRMELALLDAHRDGRVTLPLIIARFDQEPLLKKFTVTSLEAPHRIADALFRDSLLGGVMFRKSEKGRLLDTADVRNATGLFGLCPTALLFGLWDSTGPRGGLGTKFQRVIVSEIVGYDAVPGIAANGKVDSIPILKSAATLYKRDGDSDAAPTWTLSEENARTEKNKVVSVGKEGKPSEVNLGGITPDYAYAKHNGQIIYETVTDAQGRERRGKPRILGGFTISKAVQATVVSFAALRRLRFPASGETVADSKVDLAARVTLAALGLAAATLARYDADLRSRCQLIAQSSPVWELLDKPGETPARYELDADSAMALLGQAIEEAKAAGLPWEGEIELIPHDELVELVRRSQENVSTQGGEEA